MEPETEIPGLIAISETHNPGGGSTFTFEIEDDKVDQFFQAFGLQPGDQEGFQRVVIEAIEAMIARGARNQ
jgi:hypothetical protein